MTDTTDAQDGFNNITKPAGPATPDKGRTAGRPLLLEVGLWGPLGRGLLFSIGVLLVIPAPWVATMFFRYIVEHIRVPGRPNIRFVAHPRVGHWHGVHNSHSVGATLVRDLVHLAGHPG
jgi:hypothetical protein